jgi:transcriptional regulator with XRE-family HTH domain
MKAKSKKIQPKPKHVQTLGKNVRKYRQAKKLTQQDVAEGARLELSTILRIEHAKFDTTLASLARVRRTLDVSWANLLNGI